MNFTIQKIPQFGGRFVLTFVRYLLAVVLAYAVSMLFAFLLLLRFPNLKNPTIALIGFAGVFLPSFILPRQSRVAGAIFLLLLGIFYTSTLTVVYWEPLLPQIRRQLPLLLLLAGGLIAIGFHYFSTRQKTVIHDKNHNNQREP